MGQSTGIMLDPKMDLPLHRQIFDQVVSRIRSGTFPVGFRLPPTRTLAQELHTHRNTVVRVYEDLESAGFVSSRVGRGTFVAQPPPAVVSRLPVDRPPLPWQQLVSRASEAEPLSRPERLAPSTGAPSDLIDLAHMEPSADLIPAELFRRCVDHLLKGQGARVLSYAPREGAQRLREAIVVDLGRQGVPASADDIIVTNGSQQALDLVARVLVNPGDPFLVDECTYTGAMNTLAVAGARLIGVPSDEEGPQLAALERLERSGAKGFYLMPNVHNPTGQQISAARRDALVAWSHRTGVPLIEDDYACDLNLDGPPDPPALRALDGEVIHVATFSKRLIPGLRIGFIVCPPALRPRLLALKQATDLCASPLMQHALAEFLERGYLLAHLTRILPEYRRRRDALERGLSMHLPPALRWRHPQSGVTLWLPLPPLYPPEAVFEEAQRQGVLVRPSMLSGVDPRQHPGVRLVFSSAPPDRLLESARRLGRALTIVGERQTSRNRPVMAALGAV
jgi:2-aminoadipate transaminase